jgi:hypothetical protein
VGLFDNWRTKLRETNDALAGAHKSWRDEKLGAREARASEREQSLKEREAAVTLKLAEVRAIEARRFRRRLGTGLIAATTGFLGFAWGANLARITNPAPSLPTTDAVSASAANSEYRNEASAAANPAPENPGRRLPAGRSPATSTRPHYPNPDQAARDGLYGTGGKFNVGWYCLDKEDQGKITFEQCLGVAAEWAKSLQN